MEKGPVARREKNREPPSRIFGGDLGELPGLVVKEDETTRGTLT